MSTSSLFIFEIFSLAAAVTMPKQQKGHNDKPPKKPLKKMPKKQLKATPKLAKKPKKKELKKQKTPEELHDAKSHKNRNLNQWDPEQLKVTRKLWDAQQKPRYIGKIWLICGLHKLRGIPHSTLRYIFYIIY